MFEFFKFGIVGGVATGLHYLIYYLLLTVTNYSIAFTIGYSLSMLVNFLLTTYFTFGVKPTLKKGLGFAFSHLINYMLQISFLHLFIALKISEELAPVPVFALCIPINFLLVRFFVKRK
jgi:putative flippase GtrA